MIVVQDKIEIPGNQLERLQQLFHENYIPAATQRGLQFIEFLVSTPVKLEEAPSTLWVRWHVSDPGAWWAMRAQSGNPSVMAFWNEVDSFCLARQRAYLSVDAPKNLPQAADLTQYAVQTRGYRETAQLALRDDLNDLDRSEFEKILLGAASEIPGLEASNLGANLAPEYAAGHYTWDLLYADQTAAVAAKLSDAWRSRVLPALARYCVACHALELDTIGAGARQLGIANAIKRTAYFRMLPGASTQLGARFEQDLLEMPRQIPEILNWRLSRATALPWDTSTCARWDYVWEQEYESLDSLLGPYMAHPHHWAHVDRWFDPESGAQAVDVQLSHAFCAIANSILGRESA